MTLPYCCITQVRGTRPTTQACKQHHWKARKTFFFLKKNGQAENFVQAISQTECEVSLN